MQKFTKIKEDLESKKFYKIESKINLIIEATSNGEASYRADSQLGSIKNQSNFKISNIVEITKSEYKKLNLNESSSDNELSAEQKILDLWYERFDNRIATETEKYEFYHDMRDLKYDGNVIFQILKEKI